MAKLYGSVKETTYRYYIASIDNNPRLSAGTFNAKWLSLYGVMLKVPSSLSVYGTGLKSVVLNFSDSTSRELFSYSGTYTNQGSAWGFYPNQEPADGTVYVNTSPYIYSSVAKEITKLYGSVWVEEEKTELTYNSTDSYDVTLTFDEPAFLSYIKGRTYSSGTYKDVDGLIVNYIAGTNTYTISLYDGSTLVSQEITNTQPTWITNIDDSSPSWQEHDDVAYSATEGYQAKRIRKLYGPVNGYTKLIFEDTNA